MTRLLVLVVALVLVGPGCGAAENDAAEADADLALAAEKTEGTGSSRLALWGETAAEGQGRVEIACTGEAEYAAKRLRLSCDYGDEGRLAVITLAGISYMRGDVLGLGGDGKWIELAGSGPSEDLSPQRMLALLRTASVSTETVGDEPVRGVDTVRYRLVVDCGKAELTECDAETSPVDVWIDAEGLVRRIAVSGGGPSPFTFEFFDFGADVSIEAPSRDEVFEVDPLSGAHPCRPSAGSPLTGTDVADALRGHGLDVAARDECIGDTVAVFTREAPGSNGTSYAYCAVSRTAEPGTNDAGGLKTAEVGNVYCAYTADLAGSLDGAMAALARRIHP